MALGHMIDDKILSEPLVYYCPNKMSMYNPKTSGYNSWTGETRRMGYNVTPNYQEWQNNKFRVIEGGDKKYTSEMDGEAVTMDIAFGPNYGRAHNDGVAVQFADGGSRFIKFSAVKSKWKLLNGISASYNTKMQDLWKEMKKVR
jgi:hypothetical protein